MCVRWTGLDGTGGNCELVRAEVNDGLTMQGLLGQVFTASSYGAEVLCFMELFYIVASEFVSGLFIWWVEGQEQ